MSPFSAPFFWGTQKRGLLLPRQAAALWEGTRWCKSGTGKAEDAKLQDAGISLKQCPGKRVAYCTQQQWESGTRPCCQLREKRIKSSISCTCRLARKYESQLGLAQSAAYRIG
jgi:hypothetical protein